MPKKRKKPKKNSSKKKKKKIPLKKRSATKRKKIKKTQRKRKFRKKKVIKKTRNKRKFQRNFLNEKIDSATQETIFKPKPEWIKNGLANKSQYQIKYSESIKNNNSFWKKEGKRITWIKPYKKIKDVKYSKEEV